MESKSIKCLKSLLLPGIFIPGNWKNGNMFIKKKVTTGNDFIYQFSIDGDDYNIIYLPKKKRSTCEKQTSFVSICKSG